MAFLARAAALTLLLSVCGFAQLPEGTGKAETERLCSTCHDVNKAVSLRQDEAGWGATVLKMIDFGAKIESDDMVKVLELR
jgi:hypothetical protein